MFGFRSNPGRSIRNAGLMLGLFLGACAPHYELEAAGVPPLDSEVKAAFLMNFTKFVEWPEAAFAGGNSPISICILGDDPFGRALDQVVEGEAVNDRKLAVQRLRRPPPTKSCQVVFVNLPERDLSNILSGLGPGVLTVGEGDGFLREGGVIAFAIENRRVRFDINETAARKAGLKLSSKLLNVARSVEK